MEGVAGGGDTDVTVGIPVAVVGEGGYVAVEPDVVGTVVDAGVEHQGLLERQVDVEEALQPVGLAHHQSQAEVVVGVGLYGQEAWQ